MNTLKHSQGKPKDSWSAEQYVAYYNRIIKELNFPPVNKAGDPSCRAELKDDGIRLVVRYYGHLMYLPIGGSESYISQILLAQKLLVATREILPAEVVIVLEQAERFISGFEGDNAQEEPVEPLLNSIRQYIKQ